MNEEEFITKFYSCDNEEQFLKDICHNLNCLQKVQNNWNELKKGIEDVLKTTYEKWGRNCANEFDLGCLEIEMTMNNYGEILSKMQELEGNNEN